MRPCPKLAAETRANELGDDAHVLVRQTEHLREHAPQIEDGLRLLIDGQVITVPHCSCSLQFDGNVRLGWRDIGLIELHRCTGKGRRSIAALALHALLRPVTGSDDRRIIVGCELEFDVGLVFRVANDNRVRGGFGALESVSDGERDVLTIVANDIVLEGRTPFYANAFIPLPGARTENFSVVFPLKIRTPASRLFAGRGSDLGVLAVRDRALTGTAINKPGKWEVGC